MGTSTQGSSSLTAFNMSSNMLFTFATLFLVIGCTVCDGQATYGSSQAVYAADAGQDLIAQLQGSIPGVPGEDYPIYAEVPQTGFICDDKIDGGYYADPEAECQAFHICTADGQGGLAKYSFLCPNGTILNQNYLVCDWWFNFDCTEAEAIAEEVNAALAEERAAASGDQAAYGAPPADAYSAVGAADDYSVGAADSSLGSYNEAARGGRRLGGRRNNRQRGRASRGRRF